MKFKSHIKYSIVAFGGAGADIVKNLARIGLPSARLHLFDTDSRVIGGHGISGRHLVGNDILEGKGTFSNTDDGKLAYRDARDYLMRICAEDNLFVIVGALGGGTFSAMAPIFAESLASQNKKFVVIAKWPNDEPAVNVGIAHQALDALDASRENVLLYIGSTVTEMLILHGKENGYRVLNKRIAGDIKLLLSREGTKFIENNTVDARRLHDRFNNIKAYIEGYEWIVGIDDDALFLSRTNIALLDTIHSGETKVYWNTPRKFEELTEEILKAAGYETTLTKMTRDKGADILVKMLMPFQEPANGVVQTKLKGEGKKIDRDEVRLLEQTRADFNADTGMFVSSVDFSRESIEWARSKKLKLHRFYELLDEYKRNYQGRVLRFPRRHEGANNTELSD